ncbi:hypothetical protein [Rhizobium sp. L245/93]|uniref:hypothetical protein n=1 Tax=Rhizobium sp. L245/93 TaxID=2819998 RepID=UPI001ADA1167|nr:hypothetical protein [Rhizobium sp. L245/93]MBO9170033.1 hypothetical protein [Rhizobium sp. L245/93]
MAARAGLSVIDRSGRKTTLGPILQREGQLYSVVASHAVEVNSPIRIVGTDTEVGTPIRGQSDTGNEYERDISLTLQTLKLSAGTRVEPKPDFSKLDDPLHYLGKHVRKHSSSGVTEGVVTAIDSPFYMWAKDGKSVLRYRGAIEISAGEKFAHDGDAGSPIATSDGNVIGVLIGTADGRYYAAPTSSLKEELNFELASPSDIKKHNAKIGIDWVHHSKGLIIGSAALAQTGSSLSYPLILNTLAAFSASHRYSLPEPDHLGWDQLLGLHRTKTESRLAMRFLQSNLIPQVDETILAAPAPKLRANDFFEKVRDIAIALKNGDDEGVYSARTNYVTGAKDVLSSPDAGYKIVMDGLKEAWSKIDSQMTDILERYPHDVSSSAYLRLQSGKPVSLVSAWLFLLGLRETVSVDNPHIWQNISVDPAVFYAEEDASKIMRELNDKRLRRTFEDTFLLVAPQFKNVSIHQLMNEVAQGKAVRYTTAAAISEVSRAVRNWGLTWRELWRGAAQPAQAEVMVVTSAYTKQASAKSANAKS